MKHLLLFLFLFFSSITNHAQTIWNAGSFNFSKPSNIQTFDFITPQTSLTRVTVLYNAVCQTVAGNQGCAYAGPCNTEWAIGDIAN